jgi:4-diphosphocytidyl-2-C-methyl-D-erythritol kinase
MIQEFARAKINLTLDILSKRDDGFHEIETIMQTLELADVVELEAADEITLTISGNKTLPTDEKNLAYRAVLEVKKFCKKDFGAAITLTKNIPVSAGLGGGSSDAAAVIRGLNQLYDLNLSVKDMCKIGAAIGSDVPFCIKGGTCLASGRGEKLKQLKDLDTFDVVLIKPYGEISTEWAYKMYDEKPATEHPPTAEIVKLLNKKKYDEAFKQFANVLEKISSRKNFNVKNYIIFLKKCNVKFAGMSGSGPSVFALTDEATAKKISKNFTGRAQFFTTKTFGQVI